MLTVADTFPLLCIEKLGGVLGVALRDVGSGTPKEIRLEPEPFPAR